MKSKAPTVYFIFFILLGLFLHHNLLFNSYSFGRHWDWALYPISEFYTNYLHANMFAMKSNSLGYFDLITTNIAEEILKITILGIYQFFSFINLKVMTISVIYKAMVFVVLPLLSSGGMWLLVTKMFKEQYRRSPYTIMLLAIATNLLFTFSVIYLFDIHGGALNRQTSAVLFPWFFYALYSYFHNTKDRFISKHIFILALFFALYDLANIFYFSVFSLAVIFLKENPFRKKLVHSALFGILIILINISWLHGFFIGDSISLTTILNERNANYLPTKQMSSTYFQTFFPVNSPNNLIVRTFKDSALLYVPYFTMVVLMLRYLITMPLRKENSRLILLILIGFIFISLLVNGIYSIGHTNHFLYQIYVLDFIKGAVRYVALLAMYLVFMFLVFLKERDTFDIFDKIGLGVIITTSSFFLLTHTPITETIIKNVNVPQQYNQDVSSLYTYQGKPYETLRTDQLNYNVLPIPSWISPFFNSNIYPKTSQGSNTDNLYLGKGILFTNGAPLFSSHYFSPFVSNPNPYFLSFANVGNILLTPDITAVEEHNFSKEWLQKLYPDDSKIIVERSKDYTLYRPARLNFYPMVYVPRTILNENIPSQAIATYLSKLPLGIRHPIALYLQAQNTDKVNQIMKSVRLDSSVRQPVTEYRELNPTRLRIVMHGVTQKTPLVLSKAFYPGWKLYQIEPQTSMSKKTLSNQMKHYTIRKGSEASQATKDELDRFIQEGTISSLGDLSDKHFDLKQFSNGEEKYIGKEMFKIDYISKNLQGTIQNENLTDRVYKRENQVSSDYHFRVNSFANGWLIDPDKLCNQGLCNKNDDGSYDLEFIVNFDPQQTYQFALIVSYITIAGSLIFVYLKKQ